MRRAELLDHLVLYIFNNIPNPIKFLIHFNTWLKRLVGKVTKIDDDDAVQNWVNPHLRVKSGDCKSFHKTSV